MIETSAKTTAQRTCSSEDKKKPPIKMTKK